MALKHGGDPNALNMGNRYSPNSTPLFYALYHKHLYIESGRVRKVELLISAGANINHQDAEGGTPLRRAAESGAYEIVLRLLLEGADPATINWPAARWAGGPRLRCAP